ASRNGNDDAFDFPFGLRLSLGFDAGLLLLCSPADPYNLDDRCGTGCDPARSRLGRIAVALPRAMHHGHRIVCGEPPQISQATGMRRKRQRTEDRRQGSLSSVLCSLPLSTAVRQPEPWQGTLLLLLPSSL